MSDFYHIKTVSHLLDMVFARFDSVELYYGHGTDNAWDEAVQLVLFVMQLPIGSGDDVLVLPVTEQHCLACEALVHDRIATRQPLAYLTHQAYFMQLPFFVDRRVIIPRSPFAEWIDRQFVPWVEPASIHRVLDLCTGSGCIAIAVAIRFSDASVTAVDIDEQALQVARKNIDDYQLQDRIALLASDGFSTLSHQKYDLILSNPPYVSSHEMATLPDEYRYEPRQALEAPQNGLALVMKWLSEVASFLSPGGVLFMEVGNGDEALQALLPSVPFMWLEQANGGHGIFMLTYDQLIRYRQEFENKCL